jgi:hypothetical protein
MSATGRGGIRLDDDAYETPLWTFDQFRPFLEGICNHHRTILEPGAGVGNLVKGLRGAFPNAGITAMEIRGECEPFLHDAGADRVIITNFEDPNVVDYGRYDLIFGNPPFGGKKYLKGGGENPCYGLWLRFVKKGLTLLSDGGALIFLLRAAVLEGTDRNDWMRNHVPDVYVLPKRPSFTGKGQDSTAYAWMAWTKQERAQGKITILPNP